VYRVATKFGGSADIEAEIRAVLDWKADLSPIRQRVTEIVQETNKEDRLEGLDRHGGYVLALSSSTLKDRKGDPTPFVEHGMASRVIANLIVIVEFAAGRMGIGLRWVGMPWLRYHLGGGPVIPQRDFAGLSPWALPLIDAAVVAEADRQFPGTNRPVGSGPHGVDH
jgi:hypothetical protein